MVPPKGTVLFSHSFFHSIPAPIYKYLYKPSQNHFCWKVLGKKNSAWSRHLGQTIQPEPLTSWSLKKC